MNKPSLFVGIRAYALAFCFTFLYSQNTTAVLVDGSVLNFIPAPGSPASTQPALGSGSWFAIEPNVFSNYVSLISHDGIRIGTTQPASGSHSGVPDGSESPGIDEPHDWFGSTGMLGSSSPVNLLSATGNTATLDFTGLVWDWNGVDNIRLYDPTFGDTGVATITCAADCSYGDTYVLDYMGHIREGDGGLGGEEVIIHLEGTISAVPIPPALYLFGSGLLGLIGLSRRKNTV